MNGKAIGQFFLSILRFHKKKLLLVVLSSIVFFVILFPWSDLSDYITMEIAKATRNKVFLQFDDMGLSLLPSPSVKMTNVKLNTVGFPTIKSQSLFISPSLLSLISQEIGFSTTAEGLFNGDVFLSYGTGKKIEPTKPEKWQTIDLDLEKISLKKVLKLIGSPVKISGTLNGAAELEVDPRMAEQPKGEIELTIKNAKMPTSVPIPQWGSLVLPKIIFSAIKAKVRLVGGELVIENTAFGKENEPISGRFKGKMGLQLIKRGNQVIPRPGSYDFRLDLLVKSSLKKQLSLFLGFIDKHKVPTKQGDRYLLRLRGRNFINPPDMSSINKF